MAKTLIPEGLKGKDLYKFLVQNKSVLIAEKKSMPMKYSEAIVVPPSLFHLKDGSAIKSAGNDIPADVETIRVKVVANAAYWADSYLDVGIPGYCDKTITERKNRLVHLHDHIYRIDAKVGEVVNVYAQNMSLTELGLSKQGSTEAIIWETDIKRSYNEQVFNQYKTGKINQHSIGLQYVLLELAINDQDYKEEFATWNKYYDKIINKDVVDQYGYFWAMIEIKLLENSAVLFGANELTPTLEISDSTKHQPGMPTGTEPPKSGISSIDWKSIMNK